MSVAANVAEELLGRNFAETDTMTRLSDGNQTAMEAKWHVTKRVASWPGTFEDHQSIEVFPQEFPTCFAPIISIVFEKVLICRRRVALLTRFVVQIHRYFLAVAGKTNAHVHSTLPAIFRYKWRMTVSTLSFGVLLS